MKTQKQYITTLGTNVLETRIPRTGFWDACLMLIAAQFLIAANCFSAILVVPGSYSTIQSAVIAAASGDTIQVSPGNYTENVLINKNVTLESTGGRSVTTITGISGVGSLGTVLVTSSTTAVTLGGNGKGFTIVGIDNGSPGLENAAVYFQGGHSGVQIIGNEIQANGDVGLLSEFGMVISNWLIDSNVFSGQTFVGANPADYGFANQFTTANVPRQLVVMGNGGGNLASATATNITFTNNVISGVAGGINISSQEQGNQLVTLDVASSTITGNTFQGTTTRFAGSLRVRRPNTTISGNTFVSAGLGINTSQLFVQNNTATLQTMAAANTFDKGVYVNNSTTVGLSIQAFVTAVASGTTVNVLGGTYAENVATAANSVTLAPGASTGKIVINGSLTLDANDSLAFDINGATAGVGYDQWEVAGPVTLGGAASLFAGSYSVLSGQTFVLVNNDLADAVTGIFSGLSEGITISNFIGSGLPAVITYAGGDGNDVVLTILGVSVVGPDLVIETPSGYDTTNDSLTLKINGPNLRLSDPNNPLFAGPGAIQIDANTIEIPLASITGSIVFQGTGGDDVLTIDLSSGDPLPPGGITFNGGSGSDALRVVGNGQVVVYTPDAVNDGNGSILTGGKTIAFTGLEPIDFVGVALTLNLPGANDIVDLANGFLIDGTTPATVLTGTSAGVGFENARVRNSSITIDTTSVAGTDAITVTSADNAHLNTSLTLTTGAETGDTITVNGTTTVTGTTTLNAKTIALNANVTNAVSGSVATAVTVASPGQIQDSIDSSAASATVNIGPGVYPEDVLVNKSLTLKGASAATTIIQGVLGGANETILIGSNQVIEGFTITRQTGGSENNIGLTVTTGATGSILRNCIFTGNRTAIYLNGGNSQATITRNTIDNNRTGFLLPDGTGYGAYVITENNITNNKTFGVLFNAATAINSAFTLSFNNISGNYAVQVENNSGSVINASANWWGGAAPIVTASMINGTLPGTFAYPGPAIPPGSPYPYDITGSAATSVDYTPLIVSGVDTDVVTPGFQGDLSILSIVNASPQSGTGGRIQEGATLATSGGQVNVSSGTYNEQVLVAKPVSIIGATVPSKPILNFTGTVTGKPALIDVSVANVTLQNLVLDVDFKKLSSAIIASGTSIAGLQVLNNNITPYASSAGASFAAYGNRNAISINYGGSTNYRVTGGGGQVVVTGNVIAGRIDTDPLAFGAARFFRSGVSMDECSGTFDGNTIQTINHDILARFGSAGTVQIQNNQFNGSGVQLSEQNAGMTALNVINNTFNGSAAITLSGTAVLRLQNNQQNIPTTVSGNTFTQHNWGISLENYKNTTVSGNTFTPGTVASYRHITVNTKSLTTNSASIVQTPISASITGNTFNDSSPTSPGVALAFYNHDSDAAALGSFTLTGNTFNAGITNFILLDASTGATIPAPPAFPEYNLGGGSSTLMAPWTAGIDAANNSFDVGTGAKLPSTMSPAELTALENHVLHGADTAGLGIVRVNAGELYVSSGGLIQTAINAATAGDTVNVGPGVYPEDVLVNKTITLKGAGSATTTISGPIGGSNVTVLIQESNVVVEGFTLTRAGNNPTDWNNSGLNNAGVAIQGLGFTGTVIRNNIITGMRTAIDINNSNGHSIVNNVISSNRTGLILRNQTDSLIVEQNVITGNHTVGILFLDASGGSNSPVQSAVGCSFTNNNITGNWYGQIVDRQAGGSLPAPGTNVKDFSGNWFGSVTPVISTANSAEPGYAALIPVEFGGTATAPGGQPDILGAASANFDITPLLIVGTDTDVETSLNRGTHGFQGDFSNVLVVAVGAQAGPVGRIQDGINRVALAGTVNVSSGTYTGDVNTASKAVTLATGASPGQVTVNGNLTLDSNDSLPVEINGTTAGTGYDQWLVNGAVNLGGATLSLSGSYTTLTNQAFTLVSNDNTDAVIGTFNGLAEGSIITFNGIPLLLSYVGGNGNEVTLTYLNEIIVHNGSHSLAPLLVDGQFTPVDFGSTAPNVASVRNFLVRNIGIADLTISDITVPAGYVTTGTSSPVVLAPGTSYGFQVSLDDSSPATYSGNVIINNDDLDEPAFDFPITGIVVTPGSAPVVNVGGEVAVQGTTGSTALGGPPGSTLYQFIGSPALNSSGVLASAVQIRHADASLHTGIMVGQPLALIAADSQAAPGLPGVTHFNFGPPVINETGHIAFIGEVRGTGITPNLNSRALFSNASDGTLKLVARTGSNVGLTSNLKTIGNFSIGGDLVIFLGTLVDNRVVLFGWDASSGLRPLVRTGQSLSANGTTKSVKSISILETTNASSGHGKEISVAPTGESLVTLAVAFTDGTSGVIVGSFDGTSDTGFGVTYGASQQLADTYASPGVIPLAKWNSFRSPGFDNTGRYYGFISQMVTNTLAGVSSTNNVGVFVDTAPGVLTLQLRENTAATGTTTGVVFSDFSDLVLGGGDYEFLVKAEVRGTGVVTNVNNVGLWAQHATNGLVLVAREGSEAPGVSGSTFSRINQIALPGTAQPLFQATLTTGVGGVTAANDTGLWVINESNNLVLAVREGTVLNVGGTPRTVTAITALLNGTTTGGALGRRTFLEDGRLTLLLTFSGGIQVNAEVVVP